MGGTRGLHGVHGMHGMRTAQSPAPALNIYGTEGSGLGAAPSSRRLNSCPRLCCVRCSYYKPETRGLDFEVRFGYQQLRMQRVA